MTMAFPSLPPAVDHFAPFLLNAAARSLILLAAIGLAAAALRRASAASRHWLWLLGMTGLLLLPIFSALLPAWTLLARPRAIHDAKPLALAPAASIAPVAALAPATPASPIAAPASLAMQSSPSPAQAVVSGPSAPDLSATSAPVAASSFIPVPPRQSATSFSWAFWLMVAWLAGASLIALQLLLGHLSLWSLQRRSRAITDPVWQPLLADLCGLLRIRRRVELLISSRRTMPMTWGLWRSRLLMPGEAAGWSPEQRRQVLLHELGHIQRRDCLAQLLAQIACALYWFNPLVWIAWRRMQVERERACDDLVLATGARPSAYAQHLLQSASALPVLRFAGPAVAMARPSTLEERLRAILDPHKNRRTLGRLAPCATFLLLLAALAPVATLSAQPAAATSATPAAPFPPGYAAAGAVPPPPGYRAEGESPLRVADEAPAPATRPEGRAAGRGKGSRGFAGGTPFGQSPSASPSLGSGPTCTFDATIYDVHLPVDKIGQLDIDALTKASASAADFEKALAQLGSSQPLYRANQSVRLAGDSITIATQTPYVTNSQRTSSGETLNSVAYSQTGAVFSLAGKSDAPGSIDLDLSIELATISEGTTPLNEGVKAVKFRHTKLLHKGAVDPRKPFVVLSIDGASVDADGKAVAYIGRITLGDPQPPAAK
jgi:beta-lactamase regulating signal transducer with metallopeptidase domain